MIRRIGYAGAGLCAFLLPACVSNWNPTTDPYYANVNTGVPVGTYQQGRTPSANAVPAPATSTGTVAGRTSDGQVPLVQTGGTGLVDAPIVSVATESAERKDSEKPKAELAKTIDPPKSASLPAKLPANDDIVIRPKWPNLGGEPPMEISSSAKTFDNPLPDPVQEKLVSPGRKDFEAGTNERPLPVLVEPLPLKLPPKPTEFNTAPSITPPPPVPVQPASVAIPVPNIPVNETALIKALRAFQNNRPDEAIALLRQLDPTNQDVLLYLMPLMVRLGEKNMQSLPPEELASLVDRLQQATAMLKSKAALRLERVCFCRAVRKFGEVEAFEEHHEFKPDDMVHLYLEIRNFTCKSTGETGPAGKSSGVVPAGGAPEPSYSIKLATRLEICDPQGHPIVHWDLQKDDRAHTPPQDYYHTYRFSVPKTLAPGNYTLWVTVADQNKPDSPAVRLPLELRVGRN